jgi:hypothetical protein
MYILRLDQVFEVFSGTKEDFRYLVECAAEVVIVFELDGGKRGFANGCDPEEIVRDFLADQGRAGFGDTNPNRVGAIYSAPSLAFALIFLTGGGFHSPVSASRFGA